MVKKCFKKLMFKTFIKANEKLISKGPPAFTKREYTSMTVTGSFM